MTLSVRLLLLDSGSFEVSAPPSCWLVLGLCSSATLARSMPVLICIHDSLAVPAHHHSMLALAWRSSGGLARSSTMLVVPADSLLVYAHPWRRQTVPLLDWPVKPKVAALDLGHAPIWVVPDDTLDLLIH